MDKADLLAVQRQCNDEVFISDERNLDHIHYLGDNQIDIYLDWNVVKSNSLIDNLVAAFSNKLTIDVLFYQTSQQVVLPSNPISSSNKFKLGHDTFFRFHECMCSRISSIVISYPSLSVSSVRVTYTLF